MVVEFDRATYSFTRMASMGSRHDPGMPVARDAHEVVLRSFRQSVKGSVAVGTCNPTSMPAGAASIAIYNAVGGVADRPEVRDWPGLSGSALDDALNRFAYELDARQDVHATARYRRELVRRVGRAVIEEAVQCHA